MPYQLQVSPVSISIDCLGTTKYQALLDTDGALESATPQIKQMYTRMTQEHLAMADEWFRLMNSRGWYQVPQARPETVAQAVNHIQTVISQAQSTAAQANIQQIQQQPGFSPQYR